MDRLLLLFTAVLLARPALAADFQISATTVGQGYEIGAADGTAVARRRLSQFVRVNGYNLLPENQLYFVSSFRLDADFGLEGLDLAIPGQHLRQGIRDLQSPNFSLLYGYLAGRNLYGRIDFDAGRQFVVDLVDYFHFDGVRIGVNTPWYFGVEAYTGYEVRAGAALGTSAFDLPGVAEVSDRAPTFGAGIYLRNTHWGKYNLSGKVTYRRTHASRSCAGSTRFECDRLEQGDDVRQEFETGAVIEERLSTNLQVTLDHFRVWGGFSYNLVNAWLDDVVVGAQERLLQNRLVLEAEYLRTRPRFDADSIFNLFSTRELDDLRFKVGWLFENGYEAYARGYVRFFHADRIVLTEPDAAVTTARGLVLGGRIPHGGRDYTTLDLITQAGYGGYLFGGDVWSHFFLLDRRLEIDGRLLVLRFDDDRLENVHGVNLTLQGGARWQVHRLVALHLILEESVNRIYSSIFRVYGLLDLNIWL